MPYFFFEKLEKMTENLLSAAVGIGALRVKVNESFEYCSQKGQNSLPTSVVC